MASKPKPKTSLSQIAPPPPDPMLSGQATPPAFNRPLPVGVKPESVSANIPYGVDPRVVTPDGNSIRFTSVDYEQPKGLGRWQDARKVAPANPFANYGYTPPDFIQAPPPRPVAGTGAAPTVAVQPQGSPTPLVDASIGKGAVPIAKPAGLNVPPQPLLNPSPPAFRDQYGGIPDLSYNLPDFNPAFPPEVNDAVRQLARRRVRGR